MASLSVQCSESTQVANVMPSQQYQPSVRSVGSGISEVEGANHKAWSVDLEKGGTRAEGEAEKGIDG